MSLGQILLLILAVPVTYLLLFVLLRLEEQLAETEPSADASRPPQPPIPVGELVIRDDRVPVRRLTAIG